MTWQLLWKAIDLLREYKRRYKKLEAEKYDLEADNRMVRALIQDLEPENARLRVALELALQYIPTSLADERERIIRIADEAGT